MMGDEWIEDNDKRYCVYTHTRLDTNVVFYVGVTGMSKIRKRAYNTTCRTVYWKRIYAKTKILVEIPYRNMTKERAAELETILIAYYGRTIDGGTLCNISTGGMVGSLGVPVTDEGRELRRKRMLGVPRPVEDRIKQGKTIKATRVMTQEWKDNIRESCKKYRPTEELKEHLKKKHVENGQSKKVGQFTLDGKLMAEYFSINEAVRQTGLDRKKITSRIKYGRRIDFIFKFLN